MGGALIFFRILVFSPICVIIKFMRSTVNTKISGENLQESRSRIRESIERKIVARFSRGNIRLQQGRYLTQEDIDARLRRALENAEKYGD